jgi:hypothetical protein
VGRCARDWPRKFTPANILRAARLFRVDRVVRPYLEAMQ